MKFLWRHELRYWLRWAGLMLIQSLIVFFIAVILLLLGWFIFSQENPFEAPRSAGFLFRGLMVSFVLYGLGVLSCTTLFSGADTTLFPFLPLTFTRQIWQGVKAHAVLLIAPPVFILVTLIVSWRASLSTDSARAARLILLEINTTLTVMALLLYPTALRVTARSERWDLFFFARRIGTWILHGIGRLGGWNFPFFPVALITLIAFAVFFFRIGGDLPGMNGFVEKVLHTGAAGRIVLFILSPLSGLPYLTASDMPLWVGRSVAAGLIALNTASIILIMQAVRRPIGQLESQRYKNWLEIRDRIEEETQTQELDSYAPVLQVIQTGNERNVRSPIFPVDRTPAVAPPVPEPDEPEAETALSGELVEPLFAPYDSSAKPLDLIEQEGNLLWRDSTDPSAKRAPSSMPFWLIGALGAGVILLTSLFPIAIRSAQRSAANRSVGEVVTLVLGSILITWGWPIFIVIRQQAYLSCISAHAHWVPLRWRDVCTRMNRLGGWKPTAVSLAGGVVLGWFIQGNVIHYAAAVVMLLLIPKVSTGMLWLDARRQATGRRLVDRLAKAACLIVILVGLFVSIAITAVDQQMANRFQFRLFMGLMLGGADLCQVACLTLIRMTKALDRRRGMDDQIVIPPGYQPKAIVS